VIAPFVVALFNQLLVAGHFIAGFKEAFLNREEARTRYHRRLFVLTDFELVSAVQATRTPR